MVYLVAVIYVGISIIQGRSMLMQKKKAELAVYLILMLIALAYSYDVMLDLELPTPGMLLKLLFEKPSQWVFPNSAH